MFLRRNFCVRTHGKRAYAIKKLRICFEETSEKKLTKWKENVMKKNYTRFRRNFRKNFIRFQIFSIFGELKVKLKKNFT